LGREVAERAGHGSRRRWAKRFKAAVLLRLGRRRAVAVVVRSVAEAPFIGGMRRWGWGEPVAAGRFVRRAVQDVVMTLRPLAGCGTRQRGRRGGTAVI